MTIPATVRCPGSGLQMASRIYVIRQIGQADRVTHERRVVAAIERGDVKEADLLRHDFEEWEAAQGQTRERLVCTVCDDPWLTPTSKGTARPHTRRLDLPSWDRVHQLRRDIHTLEDELDRQLSQLGPVAATP